MNKYDNGVASCVFSDGKYEVYLYDQRDSSRTNHDVLSPVVVKACALLQHSNQWTDVSVTGFRP